MTASLLPVLTALAPVLAGTLLGWLWVRSGRTLDAGGLTPVIAAIGAPCLVFGALARAELAPEALARTGVAAALTLGLTALAAVPALRLCGLPMRAFFASVVFPNAGNLGLPVALYGLGEEGFAHAVVFFAFSSVGNFVVGQTVAAGGVSWMSVLRMPLLWASLGGIGVSLAGVALPRPVAASIELLGAMTIPLMLLLLGAALARLRVAGLRRAATAALLRLAGGLAIGLLVAWATGLEGTARAALILQSAMPISVFSYLFAQRFGNAPGEVAGAVLLSTLAAVVTTPLLLAALAG
jgi:hypothetical protein